MGRMSAVLKSAIILTGLPLLVHAQSFTESVLAGTGTPELQSPQGLVVDQSGNVYIADAGANVVWKSLPDGELSIFAGNGTAGFSGDGGPATAASLNGPQSVAIDGAGNIFIADTRIREVTPDGIIHTYAGNGGGSGLGDGGPPLQASLACACVIAVDGSGNLFIGQTGGGGSVRLVSKGTIQTILAPKGILQLAGLAAMTLDSNGNLYLVDQTDSRAGGVAPYSWSIVTSALPTGLTLSSTGVLSGNPSAAGNFSFTVQVTDAASNTAARALSITVNAALTITTSATFPSAVIGIAYSQTLTVAGGTPPYAWSITTGKLPAGLALSGSGAITGTPTAGGNATFSIQVSDSLKATATEAVTLTVNAFSITTPSTLPAGAVGSAYSQTLAAIGGTAPDSWSITTGALPGGLTLSSSGTISGTPNAIGTSTFTAQVTDSANNQLSQSFSLTIINPPSYTIHTLAGPGLLNPILALAMDSGGNLYVASSGGNLVWKVLPNGSFAAFAGTGAAGFSGDGGPALSAQLNAPQGVAVDGSNNIYIADSSNARIRIVTPDGIIRTFAGTGVKGFQGDGGPPASAQFNAPYGLAFDATGNLFVSDTGNSRIRLVQKGIIETIVGLTPGAGTGDGGPAINARLSGQDQLAVDPSGNLYIADTQDERIRKVTPAASPDLVAAYQSGIISTIVGTGVLGSGPNQLNKPQGVAVDRGGDVFIADTFNLRVLELTASGALIQIAGTGTVGFSGDGGPAGEALINNPISVLADSAGNIYFTDSGNARLRVLVPNASAAPLSITSSSPLPGGMTGAAYNQTLSATGGLPPYQWSLTSGSLPPGLALSAAGVISGTPTAAGTSTFSAQVTDAASNTAPMSFTITVVTPISITTSSTLLAGIVGAPYSQAFSAAGGTGPYSWPITSGSLPSGLVLSSAGTITGTPAIAGTSMFTAQVADAASNTSAQTFSIVVVSGALYTIDTFAGPGLAGPEGLAADGQGNIYIADSASNVVWAASPAGALSVFAGSTGAGGYSGDGGAATAALLNAPHGVAVDSSGNVFIADSANNCIREVTTDGVIQTVAGPGTPGVSGDGGPPSAATLNSPYGIAFDGAGNLYITESVGNHVRVISNGVIQTVAQNASLQTPYGLAVDASGNLFIADGADDRVLQATPSGPIQTVDGTGTAGPGPNQLAQPRGVAVDPLGNVYIADTENSRILELSAGALVDIAGTGPAGYSGDGGPSSAAGIARPTGITLDNAGNVYFSDHDNGVVRILTPAAMLVSMARASKLSGAIAHLPFKRQLSAILGVAPYRWSLISGTLPAGLALSPGGTITGTPTSSGMFQGIWAWVRRWFLRNEPNSLCRLVQVFRISKIREI